MKMSTTRYRRQILIEQIGEEGQLELTNSKIAVVGAGGLGSPILYYLTAAGVGHIKIVDFDIFDVSNLNRQILHNETRLGMSKARSAFLTLSRLNSEIEVDYYENKITIESAEEIFKDCDLIIDAVDNIATRLVLNQHSIKHGVPVLFGAVESFEGYLYMFDPNNKDLPCYECLFPNSSNCEKREIPIVGSTAGVIGTWQASEALKYLVGYNYKNYFLKIDLLGNTIEKINFLRRNDCKACSERS